MNTFIQSFRLSLPSPLRVLLVCVLILFLAFTIIGQDTSRIDSLKSELKTALNNNDRAKLLNDLSREYANYNPRMGLTYATRALEAAKHSDLKGEIGRAYNYVGGMLLYLSDYQGSIKNFENAKRVFNQSGNVKGLADVEGNLGLVYIQMGKYVDALKAQFLALESFNEISDSFGICNTLHIISTIYMEIGNQEDALNYANKSLECNTKLKQLDGIALNEGAIANILIDLGKPNEAKTHYLKAIELWKHLGLQYDLARELSNFATYYEGQGKITNSIELASQSLNIFISLNDNHGIAFSKGNLGSYYLTAYENLLTNNVEFEGLNMSRDRLLSLAESNIREALLLAEQDQAVNITGWLSAKLAKIYEEQEESDSALYYYKYADAIQDSIKSVESKKEIEQLVTEREIMLKDKQIELDKLAVEKKRNERVYFVIGIILLVLFLIVLYKNYHNQLKSNVQLKSLNVQVNDANSALETKNYTLKNALHELQITQEQLVITERQKEKAELRSRISQDIHDDISSGLTKISWFSELFKSKLDKGVERDKLTTIVDKINNSSRDTVSKLGEIIWSTSPTRDNVQSFLSYVSNHVNSFLEGSGINYQMNFPDEVGEVSMDPEVRRNLYLIVKEALNNAFKYSKAKHIDISFKLDYDQYELSISDDGVGIDANKMRQEGHGLSNMKQRMNAIKGEWTINANLGEGTNILCRGPLDFN